MLDNNSTLRKKWKRGHPMNRRTDRGYQGWFTQNSFWVHLITIAFVAGGWATTIAFLDKRVSAIEPIVPQFTALQQEVHDIHEWVKAIK